MSGREESLALLKARMGKGQTPKKIPPKSKTTPKAKVTPKPKARAKTPKSSGKRGSLSGAKTPAEKIALLKERMGKRESPPKSETTPKAKVTPKPKVRAKTPKSSGKRGSLSEAKTPAEKIALLNERMGKQEGQDKSTPDSSRRQSAVERRRQQDMKTIAVLKKEAEQAAREAKAAAAEAKQNNKFRSRARAANIDLINERRGRGRSSIQSLGMPPVYIRLFCVVLVAAVFFLFAPSLRAKFAASEIDGSSHYDVLGITAEQVQKNPYIIVERYRKKAKKLHPDKTDDVNDVDAFLQVQEAYEALKKNHVDDFKAAKVKRAEEAEDAAQSKQVSEIVLDNPEDEVRSQMAVSLRRGRDMTNAGLGAVLGLSLAYGIEQVVGTR